MKAPRAIDPLGRSRPEIRCIDLDDITVLPGRMRRLQPEFVDVLAESMSLLGLIQPIAVRPHRRAGFALISGWHRLEAARKLGWKTIPASIWEGLSAAEAEIKEIDDNLTPAYLSPAEKILHYRRRMEIIADNPEVAEKQRRALARAAEED
jgi:ParB family chromosome partitioning protein